MVVTVAGVYGLGRTSWYLFVVMRGDHYLLYVSLLGLYYCYVHVRVCYVQGSLITFARALGYLIPSSSPSHP